MEISKRVNITIMENVSDNELDTLIESLKKISGFDFFVDCQLVIGKP